MGYFWVDVGSKKCFGVYSMILKILTFEFDLIFGLFFDFLGPQWDILEIREEFMLF